MNNSVIFLKELFTAYYSNGLIYNCREGSLAYWHEFRHDIQSRWKWFNLLFIYQLTIGLALNLLGFIIGIGGYGYHYFLLSCFFFIIPAIMYNYLELDAWIYSIKQYYSTNYVVRKWKGE